MYTENSSRVLKITKGCELNIHISDEMVCERSFMNPAYRQAMRALSEIVRQTRCFHSVESEESENEITNRLFQYSSNIIAFIAQRGGGKTSTMMSFCDIISNNIDRALYCNRYDEKCTDPCRKYENEIDKQRIESSSFYVLPPIAPSALEKGQNILYVVLSRLYCYAEDLVKKDVACNYVTENDKRKLVEVLHNCLSGINGIKHLGNNALDDLTSLQDISDGVALKKHFYDLVQCILKILKPRNGVNEKNLGYLVLQLDDADSKITGGYEVLEDVRKYLLIPNLVILVSADMECLQNVILEEHLKQFQKLNDHPEFNLTKKLSRMCRKYIDKLIPPSHMVYLPQIEKYVEAGGNKVTLQYVENSRSEEPVFSWVDSKWDLQNTLLMLIFRKTGILFASPTSYLHNIIPRTMRGLNQFIYLFSEMKDIPSINEMDWNSPESLAKAVFSQTRIAEENLARFSDYFINDWISAKIQEPKDREFFNEFIRSPNSNRERFALNYLTEKYPHSKQDYSGLAQTELYELMVRLEQTNRSQDDFLLFFTIRTLFSLESHKLVARYKNSVLQKHIEQSEIHRGSSGLLLFDYDQDILRLPKTYLLSCETQNVHLGYFKIPTKVEQFVNSFFKVTDIKKQQKMKSMLRSAGAMEILREAMDKHKETPINISTKLNKAEFGLIWDIICNEYESDKDVVRFIGKQMVTHCSSEEYNLNFINFINVVLRLGNTAFKVKELVKDEQIATQQRWFYQMQEYALTIALNWDIQNKLYKEIHFESDLLSSDSESSDNSLPLINDLFAQVDKIIKNINKGTTYEYLRTKYNIPDEDKAWGLKFSFDKWMGDELQIRPTGFTLFELINSIIFIQADDDSFTPTEHTPQKPIIPDVIS